MKRVILFVIILFAMTILTSKSSAARRNGHSLAITTTSLPSGTADTAYNGSIAATGGTTP